MARAEATNEVVTVERLVSESQKPDALAVLEDVYIKEKGWIAEKALDAFPHGSSVSWYMARVAGKPAGLLRLLYDPPLDFPPGYDVQLKGGVDWKALAARARIVEVGRFMIREEYRGKPRIVVKLMAEGILEVVQRGYTHLLTDVFEGEVHSPLKFHTRILGFERIGTHRMGELNTDANRIILALDIEEAYLRMKQRGGWVYQELTQRIASMLEERIALREAQGGGDGSASDKPASDSSSAFQN